MATHVHRMPFGAELRDDGLVRFRLWAPGQDRVSVDIDAGDKVLPMKQAQRGWFELLTDEARAGSSYQFALPDGFRVPDPASRQQAGDVHDPSLVVDAAAYQWQCEGWNGRPWEETVLYELHPGTFSPEGGFDGIRSRLDHLQKVGVTAVELMPVADFPGPRNWGYDGVLPFAPDAAYGSPSQLKRLVDDIHLRGMTAFLDVVYNHFGPEGNYLHLVSPQFFTDRHQTPWGAAIDFSMPEVRQFFIQNALYWIQEYRFDGLRFDAVHAIRDDSPRHFLVELAASVRAAVDPGRQVHLVLENDDNASRFLRRDGAAHFDAQWNDDYHHVAHVLLTGESGGYYVDYAADPRRQLVRSLTQGFVFQGEPSPYREGEVRGEPSDDLPPTSFVDFIQNHDQIGNRAFGERLTMLADPDALRAMTAVMLLAPSVPMIFMGEEWRAREPFLFFCSFGDELADAVREGRRREFARFPQFAAPEAREAIPDPNAVATFDASRLDWSRSEDEAGRASLEFYSHLLTLRREAIVPHLKSIVPDSAGTSTWDTGGLTVRWAGPRRLTLVANLSDQAAPSCKGEAGTCLYQTHAEVDYARDGERPAWSVAWLASEGAGA